MDRLPIELEEDIIARVRNFRGVYKLSLVKRSARRTLIEMGRDLARGYLAIVGEIYEIPETESLRDIQVLLWKLILLSPSRDGQELVKYMLKYCMVQYSKPKSIYKLRRLAMQTAEEYQITDYLQPDELSSPEELRRNQLKVEKYIVNFKRRNPELTSSEKVYLLREIVLAFYNFLDEEVDGYDMRMFLYKLVSIFNRERLISREMVNRIYQA